jgi:hypothetical protein
MIGPGTLAGLHAREHGSRQNARGNASELLPPLDLVAHGKGALRRQPRLGITSKTSRRRVQREA